MLAPLPNVNLLRTLKRNGEKCQMKFSEIELPSNKKFGFFFVLVFAVATGYFYTSAHLTWAYFFVAIVLILLTVTVFKADLLLPLNKLWMRFGFLLGMIVSPIILGLIFFGLFTPISLFMRLVGRDELRVKLKHKRSHWIKRNEPIKAQSFKQQF